VCLLSNRLHPSLSAWKPCSATSGSCSILSGPEPWPPLGGMMVPKLSGACFSQGWREISRATFFPNSRGAIPRSSLCSLELRGFYLMSAGLTPVSLSPASCCCLCVCVYAKLTCWRRRAGPLPFIQPKHLTEGVRKLPWGY
jgi:hypothetical protein